MTSQRVKITAIDTDKQVNDFVAAMETRNIEISSLLGKLEKRSKYLTALDQNNQKTSPYYKQEVLADLEFLVIRLRAVVANETFNVKKILSMPTYVPQNLLPIIRNRDTFLNSINQKVSEFQSDVSVAQRGVYGLTNRSF